MGLLTISYNKKTRIYTASQVLAILLCPLLQIIMAWFVSLLSTSCCRDVQSEAIFGCTHLDRRSTVNCKLEFIPFYLQNPHCKPSQWKTVSVFFQYWKASEFVHESSDDSKITSVTNAEQCFVDNPVQKILRGALPKSFWGRLEGKKSGSLKQQIWIEPSTATSIQIRILHLSYQPKKLLW